MPESGEVGQMLTMPNTQPQWIFSDNDQAYIKAGNEIHVVFRNKIKMFVCLFVYLEQKYTYIEITLLIHV